MQSQPTNLVGYAGIAGHVFIELSGIGGGQVRGLGICFGCLIGAGRGSRNENGGSYQEEGSGRGNHGASGSSR